jgi:hypothetical protein
MEASTLTTMGMMGAASVGARTEKEPDGPVVWLVDPDHWPRALLRAELIERGYDAIGFAGLDEAIVRLATERRRRPRLVLINLSGQPVTPGAVSLLSAGSVPVLGVAGATDGRGLALSAVLHRPVSLGEIADAIERTLKTRNPPTCR